MGGRKGESAFPGGSDMLEGRFVPCVQRLCGWVWRGQDGGPAWPIPSPSALFPPLMKGPDIVFEEMEKAKFICRDGITLRRTKLKAFHGKRSPG